MADAPDYYHLLEIPSDADEAEIRAAFAREIKRWHPDAGNANDSLRAQLLIVARDILVDPNQRRIYDASRRGDTIVRIETGGPSRWIFVCSQGMGECRTITEAIERATTGDKIYILPGIYREPLIKLDKSVELAGQGSSSEEVVLESEDDILYLGANGATIRGLVFRTLSNNRFAVRASADAATVSSCSFYGPGGTGMLIEGGSRIAIDGCSFAACTIGLRVEGARPVILANKFTHNTTGLLVRAGCECVIENNEFTDNQGSAVEVQNETAVKISRNRFQGGAVGVVVYPTSRGSIENNHFTGHTDRSAIFKTEGATEILVHLNHFE